MEEFDRGGKGAIQQKVFWVEGEIWEGDESICEEVPELQGNF